MGNSAMYRVLEETVGAIRRARSRRRRSGSCQLHEREDKDWEGQPRTRSLTKIERLRRTRKATRVASKEYSSALEFLDSAYAAERSRVLP